MATRVPDPTLLLGDLDARLRRLSAPTTAEVRAVRRAVSRELRNAEPRVVLSLADRLVARDAPFDRFLAYELLTSHRATLARLTATDLRRLGRGMDSWGDVDAFACYVAGPAWRARQVPDGEIARWARSRDRWWRRAGVVSTVPLNSKARGGSGDAARTLAVCRLAVDDDDPMVVKALSWALRELAKRSPRDVERFLAEHDPRLPALVRREVRSKLTTGLKSARQSARG
ncbi:MAG: DNA alkylation repair protein [Gemmatimonadaceae bacterium]